MSIRVTKFKLRGGQLQPRMNCAAGLSSSQISGFYSQTFGADKIVTEISDSKTELLASTDFQGQKPTTTPEGIQDPAYIASTYSSASYQGTGLRTTDGDLVYSAEETFVVEFIEEDEVGIL
jgi:hypothetical protein